MAVERLFGSSAGSTDPAELLDALATGVLVLGADFSVLHANVAAQGLLAIGLNQARGRAVDELFADPAPLLHVLTHVREHRETAQDCDLSLRPIGLTRDPQRVDVSVSPLEGPGGRRQYLLEISDAAPRARLNRDSELRARLESSRMMTRQLAHEIKNPLGGLRGAAQLLSKELPDDALREYTQVIINEADRLTALVDQMVAPSRPPRKTRLNIHEICEHVRSLLQAEAAAEVTVERDYDPSLPEGQFDRDQLVQALLNLGRNALQALGHRGRIVLRTRALPNAHIGLVRHRLVARIDVIDDGSGVPDSIRSTLFYPLVTARPDGTGLGLAVSQELVNRNGGMIEFESEPGRTVFSLLLPIDRPVVDPAKDTETT